MSYFQTQKAQENLAESLWHWSKDSLNPKTKSQLECAIDGYMKSSYIKGSEIIENFTSTSDIAEVTKEIGALDKILSVPDGDMKWQAAFKQVNLSENSLKWAIMTHSSGPKFEVVAEGEPIPVYSTNGEIVYAKCSKYAAGLGWTDEILRERQTNVIMDYLEMARANYNDKIASAHYSALATGAGSNTVTYQSGSATLERDIATLNKLGQEIADANVDKGYGDMSSPEIIIYANTPLKARLLTAVNYVNQGQDQSPVVWNIKPLFTTQTLLANTSHAVAVLPGRKLQRAVAQDMTVERVRDAKTQTNVFYYSSYLGAFVGDTDQTWTVEFA